MKAEVERMRKEAVLRHWRERRQVDPVSEPRFEPRLLAEEA